jgi:two-component system, NtrC family, response regulator AtoC
LGKRVLIADDEKNMRWVLKEALSAEGYEVVEAVDGKEALSAVEEEEPDLMVLDHKMPAPNGMEVLRRIRAKGHEFPIIMLTAHGNVATAVEAMKAGATEYLTKPFDLEELKLSIDKAIRVVQLSSEVERLRGELDKDWDVDGIVAGDERMAEVLHTVEKVAPTSATVMIYGESGTGKELIARAIHRLSPRTGKPFVEVHAGALPETLLESELFGYEKGAFTGAVTAKPGRFELANGGTLFLDEVGDISMGVQVKLLRVLQERRFERLGGTRSVEVDVRVLAATNRDLQKLISDGEFREDLFYRLNVVPIHLPPLRHRADDITRLIAHFLNKYGAEKRTFTPEATRMLVDYPWPGNIRELENTIERLVILAPHEKIDVDDLPAEVRAAAPASTGKPTWLLPEAGVELDSVDSELIGQALERGGGSVAKAAKLLGMSADELEERMHDLGL